MDKYLNKENNILLSIGVLTYNNPLELKRFLLGVLPQMQPRVEIVISDNSTNDDIEKIINKEFSNSYIRYFRNKENVGAEKNTILVTERSLGEYVWWFGDDEMCDGAIEHVLNILKKESKISFIFVNFHIADQGLSYPIIKISEDKFFKDKNEVLEELANVLGFMSSVIVKKEKFLAINKSELESFINSEFIPLFIVLYVLTQEGKAYFVAFPYVCCHPTLIGAASYDGFTVFAVNFLKVVKYFDKDFSKKSLKKMLAKNFGHVWRGELVGAVKRSETPIKRLKILFKFYWTFPEFWIALPFFLMPRFMNIFFYKIYQKVKKLNKVSSLTKVPWF